MPDHPEASITTGPYARTDGQQGGHDRPDTAPTEPTDPSPAHTGVSPSNDEADKPPRPPFYRRPLLMAVLVIVMLGVAIAGMRYWQYARQYESTDDAFIQGHIIQMSPKVSAQVTWVRIDDNMEVKQGDVLIELDPRDFAVALEQAQTQEGAARGRLQQAQAQLAVAEANAVNAQADLQRYQNVTANAVSRQQVDSAIAAARTAKANVDAARQQVSANQAQAAVAQSQITTDEAEVQQAQAHVQQAQLNLSYTKIYAPEDGRVTQKNVEPGNYVQTGQALFAIVPHDVWVVANFKETQLTYMRPGQPAEIEVDTYPNHPFTAVPSRMCYGVGHSASPSAFASSDA